MDWARKLLDMTVTTANLDIKSPHELWCSKPANLHLLCFLRPGDDHWEWVKKFDAKRVPYFLLGAAPNYLQRTMQILDEKSRAVFITRDAAWMDVMQSPVYVLPPDKRGGVLKRGDGRIDGLANIRPRRVGCAGCQCTWRCSNVVGTPSIHFPGADASAEDAREDSDSDGDND